MKIDIVIPVYNSQKCLSELVHQLNKALNEFSYHIYFINDCSEDNSWSKLKELTKGVNNITSVNLAKNFGQDCAIMAGLNQSRGDYIVIMDDDLQHNPMDIPSLIEQIEKTNADVCYGNYQKTQQSLFKNFGSWLNDKLANIVIKKPKYIYMSPYKIISKSLKDKVIKYDGPYPYVDGLIFRFTSKITGIDIMHYPRYAGESTYTIGKSISLWLRVLTNFSVIPLRVSTYVGIVSSLIGFLLGLYFIGLHFVGIESPEGWPSLIVSVLFIGGIQLLAIGIIGEYVGRSFIYQSKEPQYLIDEITKQVEK